VGSAVTRFVQTLFTRIKSNPHQNPHGLRADVIVSDFDGLSIGAIGIFLRDHPIRSARKYKNRNDQSFHCFPRVFSISMRLQPSFISVS
jgi:hypothetical protein